MRTRSGYAFHDYKASGRGSAPCWKGWATKVGWEILLNRAGTTFRALPDADKANLTGKTAIALMLAQPSMIKRAGAGSRWQAAGRLQAGAISSGPSARAPDSF